MKNSISLTPPKGLVDVVLDTDAYNEIDDQFAISYLLGSKEKLSVKALYAAPFYNDRADSVSDGMERSFTEIKKLLGLIGRELPVLRGSTQYLPSETEPIDSEAVRDLVDRSRSYSKENPLYVVAIGAITNVASALLTDPSMAERCVVVWLGGHSLEFDSAKEFNMMQDIAAARVVYRSGVRLIQLPCYGVVSSFTISKPELEYWLMGKTPLADYLAKNAIEYAEAYAKGKPWTRAIWDVTAVAWLLNDGERFMKMRTVQAPVPNYDLEYDKDGERVELGYVYYIKRDALMEDMINRILSL